MLPIYLTPCVFLYCWPHLSFLTYHTSGSPGVRELCLTRKGPFHYGPVYAHHLK